MDLYKKILMFLVVFLSITLIICFVFLNRKISILQQENLSLEQQNLKSDKKEVLDLKKELDLKKDSIETLKIETDKIRKNNILLKGKISKYEKIRYFDDVDSDMADSIIARSSYRHNKKNNNSK